MENTPLISIITPVYNVEAFLPQCLDSILNQTFQNWELILINDGSTDRSGVICDEYACKDIRIKVVHKANTGQADSRNLGLSMANAPYVGFVDSDDWIEKDMYEQLYRVITDYQADISMCSYFFDYADKSVAVCNDKDVEVYTRDEAVDLILMDQKIKSYPWDKLFRKEMIADLFPVSFYYEDYATVFKWIAKAAKIVFYHVPEYHYRQRIGSTSNDADPAKAYHFFCAEKQRYDYVISGNFPIEKQTFYARKFLKIAIIQAKNMAKYSSDPEEGKMYIRKIGSELAKYKSLQLHGLFLIRRLKRMKIQYFPSYFFYQVRLKWKLKFWKKSKFKLEKFY